MVEVSSARSSLRAMSLSPYNAEARHGCQRRVRLAALWGRRPAAMAAHDVQCLVGALARVAATPVHLTPHGLRDSAITIAHDLAGGNRTTRSHHGPAGWVA